MAACPSLRHVTLDLINRAYTLLCSSENMALLKDPKRMEELAKELQSHTVGRANQVCLHRASRARRTHACGTYFCLAHSHLVVGTADVYGGK